jgi:hypothetical protein
MNYGHTCRHCGETLMSNDKAEVAEFKKSHSCTGYISGVHSRTGMKCAARPSLAKHLSEQRRKK